jgi:hypothetical protein
MKYEGNIRKMSGELVGGKVHYHLPLKDILAPNEWVDMNALVGKNIRLEYEGYINSVISGKKINKAFGEGLTYDEFMNSPQAAPSIMRPELSRIHEGIALRDYQFEVEHHLKPHAVYISFTSNFKVGVTRFTQIPTRWIDQGATEALVIAIVPYRQLAGLIEISLKEHFSDKTAWQKLISRDNTPEISIIEMRKEVLKWIPEEHKVYSLSDKNPVSIEYPINQYPSQTKSLKLDKDKVIEGELLGIKGQYLFFDFGAINMRSHAGYRISMEF